MIRSLILIAVVCITGYASAINVNWGAGAGVATDGTIPLTSGTAYLLYVGADGINASWDGSTWVLGNDQVVQSAQIYTGGAFSGSWKITGISGADATGAKYAIFVTTTGVSGTTLPTSGFYGQSGVFLLPDQSVSPTDGDFALLSNVAATTAIVPVPEPASMALVLVGAGAMALRRRFKKQA